MSCSSGTPGWTREEVERDKSWIQHLSADAVSGFEHALAHAKATGKAMLNMSPEDFPLNGAASAALQKAIAGTQSAWGFCLLRGLPVTRWSIAEARLAYWGIGLHIGVARTQNSASEFMSDVRDENGSYRGKRGRGYNTNAALDFHVDFCDVVALLCLRTAKSGGASMMTSSVAVHDEIARVRPDLIETLYEPFYFSLQGAGSANDGAYYKCSIAGKKDGRLAVRVNRKNIDAAQRDFDEIPRLSAKQTEVLDLLDKLYPDPRFCYSMWLEPGDLQLLNNHVIVHSRTEFEDFDDAEQKRHLLRLWLSVPQAQPLPDLWVDAFKDIRSGAVRGGLRGSAITSEFLEYEARLARCHNMINNFR
jgi:hypothetical protein